MEKDPFLDTVSYYGTLAIATLGTAAAFRNRPVLGALTGFTIPWLMLNKPPVTRAALLPTTSASAEAGEGKAIAEKDHDYEEQ